MPKIVIADTSCLIVLTKIQALHLLKSIYSTVYITPQIANEFGEALPEWITVAKPMDTTVQQELETLLDAGEASAITLALELDDCLLILDDLQGRKIAAKMHLEFTGTLGVLVRAKHLGHVSSITSVIKNLKEIKFRISSDVERDILIQCGEL